MSGLSWEVKLAGVWGLIRVGVVSGGALLVVVAGRGFLAGRTQVFEGRRFSEAVWIEILQNTPK
jgi:hypothetical protein